MKASTDPVCTCWLCARRYATLREFSISMKRIRDRRSFECTSFVLATKTSKNASAILFVALADLAETR